MVYTLTTEYAVLDVRRNSTVDAAIARVGFELQPLVTWLIRPYPIIEEEAVNVWVSAGPLTTCGHKSYILLVSTERYRYSLHIVPEFGFMCVDAIATAASDDRVAWRVTVGDVREVLPGIYRPFKRVSSNFFYPPHPLAEGRKLHAEQVVLTLEELQDINALIPEEFFDLNVPEDARVIDDRLTGSLTETTPRRSLDSPEDVDQDGIDGVKRELRRRGLLPG